jgi:hypothetical protein
MIEGFMDKIYMYFCPGIENSIPYAKRAVIESYKLFQEEHP